MSESDTREVRAEVSAILLDGKPAQDDVHLKREVLLAQLFPTEVTRPKLGRYDVLEFVGEGGMGTVYAAYDPTLDRRVAVKLLRGTRGQQAHRRARMLREAKALARLSHPHIVTIHEVWEEQGEIFLAMEFVQGQTLAEWQPSRPLAAVIDAYRQAGEGLAAAHEAGLVYRDFKPHNVIRRQDGVIKLLDFGLARLDDAAEPAGADAGETVDDRLGAAPREPHLTRPGTIMGTPAYMAPEQHRGAPADARSDQFGFCVSLWEGLYGALPFEREPGPAVALRRVEPSRDRDVPGWVRRILERGLALEPAERYPSMRALLRELGRNPAIMRRRVLGGLAVVVSTVIGGLVIAELRAEPSDSCVLLTSPWDEPRRETAYAGVVRAGGATAEQTWTLLSPRLDRYAGELTDLRQQTCETHRRGLRSDAHYDLQGACLDRREAGFVELAELLARGDATAVANANQAIAALPSPGACTDTEALLAEQPPPDDPALAAELHGLREELARAEVEESAGLYEAAEVRAAAVLQRADALGYALLRAEALLRWGSAGMQAGRSDAPERLARALWLALVTEQRRIAAEAAAKRIFAEVELGDRTADVSEAIELARSLADRSGAADWRIRWVLANNIGVALERRGERSQALASYEAALAAVPEDGDRGAFERAVTLQNMAPVQVRLGRPVDGERSARAAVDALEQLLGEAHPHLRTAGAWLAVVLRDGGRLEEAERVLNGVLERYGEEEPPLWLLLDAARIAWRRGDLAAVRGWCRRARPRLESESDDEGEASPSLWTLAFGAMEARVAAAQGDASGLERLHALAPRVPPSLRAMAALDRAEISLLLGRRAEAEALVMPLAGDPELAEADRTTAQQLLARARAG